MKISEILQPGCVLLPLRATEKTAAITELVDALDAQGLLGHRDEVLEAVLARERTRSTGIGLGLAVPHGKSAACDQLAVAVGKPEAPIPFESVDDKPCSLIVLLASPLDQTGPHIQALASVSRLWQKESFRAAVHRAQSVGALLEAIAAHEA